MALCLPYLGNSLRFVRVCLCRYLRVRIPSDCVALSYCNMHFVSPDTILHSSVLEDTICVIITLIRLPNYVSYIYLDVPDNITTK